MGDAAKEEIMKVYNYILFDWDGCLAKSLDIALDAYKVVFKKFGISLSDKTITHEIFGDWHAPEKLGISDTKKFWKDWHDELNREYPSVELYEHVRAVLDALKKQKKKLALISSSRRQTLQEPLKRHKVTELFDVILTVDDVVKEKPDPEIINKAIDIVQGTKENSIIVGDSKSDLVAANNAEIDSLLFYPTHNHIFYDLKVLESYKPTYVVDDFRKLLDIIV
ncbi:MAG: HAD-IA family hydrolase [Candidatus Gottesmanbacteria bacterium]|nr:HAD-IA family hydrolase [Candidatus Gottesmanbacteria bacterium]